ncbi:MAG: phenylalanine--tRNA ligase subunit alpha [Candidatus Omnitrophica bacterium CG08_land_8_20_14_0_20_41_16]|uniref:Phenylalanine--tRNA ligase alpha subunit n=1 Tax=Candidatus Sherwoodlollariibacterium unditelluris TaxID=1974757 RepID=A0A2G9YKE5_9BACT|nr:MAG: phenylalanine--tRNA ligase subunit alpha [Candidatus Omnitrophica bacterium CG23_combo_of_CG06-09_8_20_14_all_41_10]PIS33423.1 MAG: phenylalanine--tRNA ligase subunit alpha [Candidatus Omnitrophica bacterium CG08_land_8_20_14_0_20_41_16]
MDINAILAQIDTEISNVNSPESLEHFRLKYLGRKGLLTQLTSTISGIAKEERPVFGQQVNSLKNKLLSLIEEKQKAISVSSKQQKLEPWDIGMPGIAQELGRLHPLTQVTDEICSIFKRMGFSVVEGPEIETEYNNFTGLNIPLEHPSREAFDTFYLKDYPKMLLRSHTSPVQIRVMQSRKPPLAVVVPGRVYRPDAVDASHSFMFHQVEGFMVDEGIKFSDLKGILEVFAKTIFGKNIKMRFRPHFFPFTEPSAEVDISCIICKGKGCSVCGRKGWLEILGSGMIHPNVFKHVNIDFKKYTGFAFGMGVERIAMLKYGINDIRLFYENDLRFLKQF